MNKIMLKEIEHQVTLAVGSLSLVTGATDDDELFIARTRAQLIGIVYGLRNVIDNMSSKAMTLGELEKAQFDRAIDVRSDRPTVQALMDENINNEFLSEMEFDATWGNN